MVGVGNIIGAFADRPEVREFVRYILSPSYGETIVAEEAGFISANRRFDLANYEPFERRQAKFFVALADDAFRFDASDLMPPPVGNDLFWDAMMRYSREGPGSLDEILNELDAAWPDDTS